MRNWLALTAALGVVFEMSSGCTREPDPTNELPFGVLDTPVSNATVQRRFAVHGWALDDDGVVIVHVYVNGRYATSAALSIPRPDVSAAYPKYARGSDLHGWGTEIALPHGSREATILAQAVDTNGAAADLGKVVVKVLP